ncbi:hypothetical protein X797_000417 [Metarhizium robertsii]|uniref:Uncharacterized protein n=1 Tax=Metarhizium robertsii TaxID=568076 RepID=A0A0A1V746_9HYPO|nr:hypothetical protein X797_000417 [Metarhizium robertsii]
MSQSWQKDCLAGPRASRVHQRMAPEKLMLDKVSSIDTGLPMLWPFLTRGSLMVVFLSAMWLKVVSLCNPACLTARRLQTDDNKQLLETMANLTTMHCTPYCTICGKLEWTRGPMQTRSIIREGLWKDTSAEATSRLSPRCDVRWKRWKGRTRATAITKPPASTPLLSMDVKGSENISMLLRTHSGRRTLAMQGDAANCGIPFRVHAEMPACG